jgi:hypothetical protein
MAERRTNMSTATGTIADLDLETCHVAHLRRTDGDSWIDIGRVLGLGPEVAELAVEKWLKTCESNRKCIRCGTKRNYRNTDLMCMPCRGTCGADPSRIAKDARNKAEKDVHKGLMRFLAEIGGTKQRSA